MQFPHKRRVIDFAWTKQLARLRIDSVFAKSSAPAGIQRGLLFGACNAERAVERCPATGRRAANAGPAERCALGIGSA